MYSDPLAYFITFRTYGTWYHGDTRGSVDRENNVFGERRLPPNEQQIRRSQQLQLAPSVILDATARTAVDAAICDACAHRRWTLLELNVRTNHVHLVVRPATGKDAMLAVFKARSTRLLRETGCIKADQPIWSEHGSTRILSSTRAVAGAAFYVRACQGETLPSDENWWERYAGLAEAELQRNQGA